VEDVSRLVIYTPEEFKRGRRVEVLINSYVKSINAKSKTLVYVSEKGEEKEISSTFSFLQWALNPYPENGGS
jgi:NADPH-dependent 2,4-dienoyl-CoA reductase/sulfur reductase-like enzyme